MHHTIAILSISAFLLCFLLIPIFEKFAKEKGYISGHTAPKVDPRRIPYFGGLAMFLVFSLVSLFAVLFSWLTFNRQMFFLFILAAGVIVLFGLYDDIKELTPIQKLIGQSIGAFIIVGFVIRTEIIYVNSFVNICISFFWIIVLINAFNLLDILDGLAAGISVINIFAFLVLGFLTQNYFVILISSILIGVLLAFLRYNLPPARIFMGDSGSQFLGFTQAIMAISLSFASVGREIGLVIPLVMFAVPLFDLLFVVLMRIRQKKSIFLKSNDHFVFRMLRFGIPSKTILRIMVVFSIIANFCAMCIFRVSNAVGAVLFLCLISLLLFFGAKLSRLEMNR